MPRLSDSEDLAMINAFIATVSGDLPSYPGVTAAMMTDLGALRDTFADDLLLHSQKQDAARAQTIAKDGSRAAADAKWRSIRDITKANGVSDAAYAASGAPASEGLSPASATVPVATVDTSERLRHTINFLDAAAGGNKRRPRGALGCEMWVKTDGTPPGSEKDCTFLALDSATPYVAEYGPEDAGKTAHYLLRWQMRDGSKSAWGETVSATITG